MESRKEEIEVTERRVIRRITLKTTLASLLQVINLQKGLGLTLKRLFLSPAGLTQEYLGEYRFKLISPFQLVIIGSSAFSLVYIFLFREETLLSTIVSGYVNAETGRAYSKEQVQQIQKLVVQFSPLLLSVFLALFSGATWWLHRRRGYNYAEVLVFVCYWYSLATLLMASFFTLGEVIKVGYSAALFLTVFMLVILIYFIQGLRQLFQRRLAAAIGVGLGLGLLGLLLLALGLGLLISLVETNIA